MDETSEAAQALGERTARALYASDRASQRLGIRITAIAPGEVQVAMRVNEDMLNGHRTCHGGLLFALADSAFAFASNSHGDTQWRRAALLIISHLRAAAMNCWPLPKSYGAAAAPVLSKWC